jgi:hypothetical protein
MDTTPDVIGTIVFIALQLGDYMWLIEQFEKRKINIDASDVDYILDGMLWFFFPLDDFILSISETESFLLVFEQLLTIIAGHVETRIKQGEDVANLWIDGVRITGPLSRLVHIKLNDRTVILKHIDARTISDAEIELELSMDWKLLVQREKKTLEWLHEVVETGANIPFPVDDSESDISDIINELSHVPDPIVLCTKIISNLYQPYHKASIHPFTVMITEYIKTFFISSGIPVYQSVKELKRNQVYENLALATTRQRIIAHYLTSTE